MKRSVLYAATMSCLLICVSCAADGGQSTDGQEAGAQVRPPNIVVIVADDLGHNDISLNGGMFVRTPNIDSIALAGARFEAGYAGDAVCAPSRAALLTGRFPSRYGMEYLPHDPAALKSRDGTYVQDQHPAMIIGPPRTPVSRDINGLPVGEETLADLLKKQGYHTAAIGKWHLGAAPHFAPTARGFDEFVGFLGGASLYGAVDDPEIVTTHLPWTGTDQYLFNILSNAITRNGISEHVGYMTDTLADAGVEFVTRNRERPFFLYLAFNAPHTPLQSPKRIYDRLDYIREPHIRNYYAMVAALDDGVGRVLDAIKSSGLEDNTIVVFTSDNGGADYTRNPYENLPFRGWKITYFEGGVNVPYFVKWPAHITPGSFVQGAASSLDLLPTLVAAAGGQLPQDREYDGVDLLPALTGARPRVLLDRSIYWRKEEYRAIRDGHWKLMTSKYPEAVWLFDLQLDPTERFNVAADRPDKVNELKTKLFEREASYVDPLWPPQYRTWVDIDGYNPHADDTSEHIFWAN